MGDSSPDPVTNDVPKTNGAIRMSLPAVFCTPIDDPSNKPIRPLLSSESKLSLPSSLSTPTSPLRLSSPMSLPTSPTPFQKITAPDLKPGSPKPSQLLAPTTETQCTTASSGSATGNPRNKCALQPGHSLMDWIRLGNSGKDLTGVGGSMRAVSPKELSTHNTPGDAWLALRGRVYNITHYLPYHPGGQEELMRGAGIDATQLFDKVHPWVNYDSLLSKCLIGPLRTEAPDAEELFGPANPSPKFDRLREPSKAQELVRKSMENLANCITPVRKKITAKSEENMQKSLNPSKIMQSLIQSSDLPVSISRKAASNLRNEVVAKTVPNPLRFDWIQTSVKLTLSVYTGPLMNPGVSVKLMEDVLLIEVASDGFLRTLKLVPEHSLRHPIQLKVFVESGKVEICVHKSEANVWRNCGETISSEATQVTSPRTLDCIVRSRKQVSHDTVMLSIEPKLGAVKVPLGHHLRIHYQINEVEQIRSYTPVGDGWDDDESSGSTPIKLAIKGYPFGAVSQRLTKLNVGDVLSISGPYGNFELNKLKNVRILNLIAAGTGITPMLGLLKFMLIRTNPRCEQVSLLFFNKKEDDILFRNYLEKIVREDSRFTATHVLSEASPSWSGRIGRVSSLHLSDVLGKGLECKPDCYTNFSCVCGPTEFTQLTLELLMKLGVTDDCLHAFMG